MKNLISAIALTAITGPALAGTIEIATGAEGGGYHGASRSISQRLTQRGYEVNITNYNGSDEITLAMCSGEANLGIAQIDAVDARALENCSLRPVGSYGTEVAVILFPPKSGLDELDDMTSEHKLLVDNVGSGTDLFWHTIKRIETGDNGNNSDWSQVVAVNDPVSMAITLAEFGDIDAVMMVRKPDSKDIHNLLNRGWTLGELYDKDIDDYEFNGDPLYESQKIKLRTLNGKHKGWGYGVKSFYLVTQDLAQDRKAFALIAGSIR